MELQDLISELRENVLHDRSDRVDGDDDYMWSDATLVRYIDEAQRRLARRGLVIQDSSTPEVVRVRLRAGQREYALHDSILAVISARVEGAARDMVKVNHTLIGGGYDPSGLANRSVLLDTGDEGLPSTFHTDDQIGESDAGTVSRVMMRVYPLPRADDDGVVVYLRVVRLPIHRLSVTNLCVQPEVPDIYHIDMLNWAAYLALRVVDRDREDYPRASVFKKDFETLVTEARNEVIKKLSAAVLWGFGRNGFAWER